MNRPWPEFCNRAAHTTGTLDAIGGWGGRSEERRVGEEGRTRGGPDHLKKKKQTMPRPVTAQERGNRTSVTRQTLRPTLRARCARSSHLRPFSGSLVRRQVQCQDAHSACA